jgi:ABC-type transport system involved in cytochrome bd biosynthesis fused ATPase/permease subunit
VSRLSKIAIGVAVVGLIVMVAFNWLAGLIVVLAAIAIPVGGYLMLDPSQRRRLRDIQRRKQIDR